MPTKHEIQEQIRVLWNEYEHIPTPEALREKALVVYTRKMLEELRAGIFNEGIDALRVVLNNNWRLVNGTALSPTAIPEADITKLFCDVAEFVADEYNKTNPVRIAAIQLLMPSITVESIRPDLFDDASKVIGEGYLNLTVRPLREILKTHILGREGQFLLPVKLLTELSLNLKIEALMNPYVPEDAMTQDIYYAITSEEYARLVAHSPLTQAVGEAHQQYQRLANDNSNLLGQLNQLCVKLAVNDAHGGIGSEENAGTGAYVPIIIFNDYYDKLTAAQKNSLPKPLIQEIEKLLTLASNPEENINATANFQTCIGTRRQKLQAAAQGNEAILEGISISGSQRESLISASIALFHKTKEELTRHLASSSYQYGRDNLGLNCQLLESLGLKFNLVSLEDLNIFKVLSADEMIELLQDDELGVQLITQIHSLENLFILIMELSPEKATAILSGSKRAISNLLIRTPQDLSALLISLEPEKFAVFIEAMKSELLRIIKSGMDFSGVLFQLTPEQRTVIFDSMKSELPMIIKAGWDFELVLHHLSPEQRAAVFDAMKSELPKIIKTAYDFTNVVNYLKPEQRTVVFNFMKSELPKLICSGHMFECVMKSLKPEDRTVFFDAMKSELPKIIKGGYCFESTLLYLNPEQRAVFFNAMKSELPKFINDGRSLYSISKYLTTTQYRAVLDSMKGKWSKFIKTDKDFISVLEKTCNMTHDAIYEDMKKELPEMITDQSSIHLICRFLRSWQRLGLCDEILKNQKTVLKMITSADVRAAVCSYLSLDQNKILEFIEKMPKNMAVESFVSALINNDSTAIKTSLMALVLGSTNLTARFLGFWSKKNNLEILVLSIVALGPHWEEKIIAALELKFPEGISPSNENFKKLLESYIKGPDKMHNTSLKT